MSLLAIEVEEAASGDVGALHALERRCHSHPWTLRHFADALADRATLRVFVLRRPSGERDAGPGLLGYCVVQVAAGEMHIHNLAVDPALRRQGLGRRLLRAALSWGAEAGAEEVFLEVRQGNWAALALYRAAGFEAVSVRRGYYDRPREDALVLRRKARQSDP
jgi:[ribosomal protein S18]-alanine N-acetyltransferase